MTVRVLITFPESDWDCIPLFRQKLMEYGLYTPKKKPLSELPAWWRDPLVCTYGDELSTLLLPDAKMNDPRFNADWVRMLVDTAEQKWGIRHMNIVLDAFWQLQFSMDGKIIHNPTATDLWIGEYYKDEAIKIPAGQTIKL